MLCIITLNGAVGAASARPRTFVDRDTRSLPGRGTVPVPSSRLDRCTEGRAPPRGAYAQGRLRTATQLPPGRTTAPPDRMDASPGGDIPPYRSRVGAMIPMRTLGETRTPDGARFSLHEHDGDYFLKLNGRQLMGSNATASETLLADLACDFPKSPAAPRILIGGLGLGFTLKRVLERLGPEGFVVVAELLPEVVAWNREFLAGLNGRLIEDRRVQVFTGDVFDCIRSATAGFDAILLDVDNGPTSFVQAGNARLYSPKGIASIRRALRPGGRVAFWSAEREPAFLAQLGNSGFTAHEYEARAHERARRAAHRIYVGEVR